MRKWLVMDLFHQVHGPYTKEEIKGLLRRGNNFFVARAGFDSWMPVDFIPEFTYIPPQPSPSDLHPPSARDAASLHNLLTELIGVCKGVIADGKVVPQEAEFLRDWLARNPEVAHLWPADVLSQRLADVFADGKVDEQEQADLLELLTKITAAQPRISQAQALAVPLPLDVPEPAVEFGKRRFCLAGKFLYGPVAKCRQAVAQRGGSVQANPTGRTDYVVIGALNSADWNACPDAGKIRSALRFKQEGQPLCIISEEHWHASLMQN